MVWASSTETQCCFLNINTVDYLCALVSNIPTFPIYELSYYREKVILECNLGSPLGFWAVLGYTGLLSLCVSFRLFLLGSSLITSMKPSSSHSVCSYFVLSGSHLSQLMSVLLENYGSCTYIFYFSIKFWFTILHICSKMLHNFDKTREKHKKTHYEEIIIYSSLSSAVLIQ